MLFLHSFHGLVAGLFLPPAILFLIGGLGLILMAFGKRIGIKLLLFAFLTLWVLSTPIVSGTLLRALMPPPVVMTGREADAIVILAGGSVADSIEYGGDTMNDVSLERARYGALLARRLHKPVLVTGGDPKHTGTPEARIIADALRNEFGVKVKWVEESSRTTMENARLSVPILEQVGIRRIYLVSHAWHLARAMREFKRLGMVVVPAGTGYHVSQIDLGSFMPTASALQNSCYAIHEMVGIAWYWLVDHMVNPGNA